MAECALRVRPPSHCRLVVYIVVAAAVLSMWLARRVRVRDARQALGGGTVRAWQRFRLPG